MRWLGGAGPMGSNVRTVAARAHCIVKRGGRNPLPVQCLPQTDIGQGRHGLRVQQAAAAPLVQGHVPADPVQEGHFQHRTRAAARRHADNRLDPQAKACPGYDGAQRGQALERRSANGRRLSRRAAPRKAYGARRGRRPSWPPFP